jgi:predicted AlkP superfamily phosphohydrolase/phosphomutase
VPEVSAGPDGPAAAGPGGLCSGTVYVIAVDAMTMDAIGPLMARGDLPGFQRMAEEGCSGQVKTLVPTISGAIWTSIACGRSPRDHGIDGLDYFRLYGRRLSKSAYRILRRLGLTGLLDRMAARGRLERHMFNSRDLTAKTFWDIVSERGGRVGVVNWLNTWPAYPVNGFLVADRMQPWRLAEAELERPQEEGLTWPEELAGELRDVLVPPHELPISALRRYVATSDDVLRQMLVEPFDKRSLGAELRHSLASDMSAANCLWRCLERFDPVDLAACFFWGMDKIQHAAYRYMPFVNAPDVTAAEQETFGNAVPESYRFIDGVIRRVSERMKAGDSLLVCSDHGFGWEARRGYGHKRCNPPGVIFALGTPFRRGHAAEGVAIYDIPATILRLCGLPLDRHMKGAPLEVWLTDEYRAAHPQPAPIDSYGDRGPDYSALPR